MQASTTGSQPKRALVTGGSGDLGGAICRQLAADGVHVVVHANANLGRAQRVVDGFARRRNRRNGRVRCRRRAATRRAIESLLLAGAVQIVVNNAGIHDDAPMAGMSEAQWRRVIDVSLHGSSTSPNRC